MLTPLVSLVVVSLLVLSTWGVGDLVWRCLARRPAEPVVALPFGLVTLHLLLQGLDLLPLPWSRWSVLLPWSLLGIAGLVSLPRRRGLSGGPRGPSWSDILAAGCAGVLALLTLGERIAASDFIFHWGLKGQKFFLAGGTDYEFLAQPWNYFLHPDYPNLTPELFALSALLEGRFTAATSLLWSVVAFGLTLLLARRMITETHLRQPFDRLGFALVALSLTSFSISWQMTGNADTWMAAAMLLGALALLRPPSVENDLLVATAAALGAATKIEGVPFAGLLVVLALARRLRDRSLDLPVVVRIVLLPAAVVVAWAVRNQVHGLSQPYYTGSFEAERLLLVPQAILDISLHDGWHGVSLLALALLPVLLWRRRFRWIGLLVSAQLAFYLFSYLTGPVDTVFWVRTSFPRLMLHLVPTLLILGVAGSLPGIATGDERRELGSADGLPAAS